MSLMFLVQASAVTGKLSSMPDTYVDGFAGSFGMFNLQLSPPRWAKSTVAGRRLMSWEEEVKGVKVVPPRVGPEDKARIWAELHPLYAFGNDETRASEALKFHLFYAIPMFFGTVLLHYMGISLIKKYKLLNPIPEPFKFPQFEIKLFLALCTGMLDVAFGVLTTVHSRVGWKFIACIYVFITVWFIQWFTARGREFRKNTKWYPLANLLTAREVDRNDPTTYVTREDLIRICGEVGLPLRDAEEMYLSLDFDGR